MKLRERRWVRATSPWRWCFAHERVEASNAGAAQRYGASRTLLMAMIMGR